MGFDSYLTSVTKRFHDHGFDMKYDVPYAGLQFSCVAKRGDFKAEFFGFYVEFFFIITHFPTIDLAGLKDYSSQCFSYTRRHKIIPFVRFVPFTNHSVFSVAAVNEIHHDTVDAIRNQDPPKHTGAREQMVVYSLGANELYCSETNPLWGGLYHEYYRYVANTYLIPSDS